MTITQARLKELLRYDSETGEFFWKISRGTVRVGRRAGWLDQDGYWRIRIDWKNQLGHRLAWLYVHGYFPKELDHKNGDKSSCRIKDLRLSTRWQNGANQKINKNNSSGFKCVSWFKRNKKWKAYTNKNGTKIHLGYFNTPEEAHAAYCAAAEKLHGEFFNSGA